MGFVDRAAKQIDDRELNESLNRLRQGQRWLIEFETQWEHIVPWPDDVVAKWQKSYDAWDEMEKSTRQRWKLTECVIGPEGCHVDAPIECGACAGRPRPSEVSGQKPATGSDKAQQPVLFSISRGH